MIVKKTEEFKHLAKAHIADVGHGILYHETMTDDWYLFHNNSSYSGGKPVDFESLKLKYGYKYSWALLCTSGETDYVVDMSGEFFSDERKEDIDKKLKSVKINYSSLEHGAEVLFGVIDDEHPEKALPTRGKLWKENYYWYILSNDSNKDGAPPPSLLSKCFDGEFSQSWCVRNSNNPYEHLNRLEILSRPKEKIKDVPKLRFAVGCKVTCLTPEQFTAQGKSHKFSCSGEFERYAGQTAVVEMGEKLGTDIIHVRWDISSECYAMRKDEFQEFYPEYLGRVKKSEPVKIDHRDLEPGIYVHDSSGSLLSFAHTPDEIRLPNSEGICTLTGLDLAKVPKDRIDALSMAILSEYEVEKFKPDPVYKYTPPIHPGENKLKGTSDFEILGDSVPRKKNIDTLLILGL